jgi:PadR family transcriptional regulator, regulatory protein PadR
MGRRPSLATVEVLRAMLDSPEIEFYGLELMRATGLSSGSLYPILRRLESGDLIQARWEDVDPSEVGRPARRMYRLTPDGVAHARSVVADTAARLRFSRTRPALGGGA